MEEIIWPWEREHRDGRSIPTTYPTTAATDTYRTGSTGYPDQIASPATDPTTAGTGYAGQSNSSSAISRISATASTYTEAWPTYRNYQDPG